MKSYFRFLGRNKLYTAIEVVGLSVAIAVALPLLSYMLQVRRVNHSHPDHENIYSLSISRMQTSTGEIGQYLQENIPEIEMTSSPSHLSGHYTFEVDGRMVPYIRYDRNFLYFFPQEFIEGKLDTEAASTMAVSESFANELSKTGTVIGRTLNLKNETYQISGIYKDNSDPRFRDFKMMLPPLKGLTGLPYTGANINVMTFLKVREGANIDALTAKVQKACADYWGPMDKKGLDNAYSYKHPEKYDLIEYEKLTTTDNYQLIESGGDGFIIMIIIAALLLIFAVLNYINLNVALSTRRAREIATRRLVGAGRIQIVELFLKEAFVMNLICFGLGILLTGVSTGMIEGFFKTLETEGSVTFCYGPAEIGVYVIFLLLITLFTGLAPARIVSRFTPLDIVKGSFRHYSKKRMTTVFICIQNILIVLLLSTTIVFKKQYQAYIDMEYNCNVDDLFYLMPDFGVNVSVETLKSELEKHPEILAVGRTDRVPSSLWIKDREVGDRERLYLSFLKCDNDAFDIYGFDIMSVNDESDMTGLWMTPEAQRVSGIYPQAFEEMLREECGEYRIAGMIQDIPVAGGQNDLRDFPVVVYVGDAECNDLLIKTIDNHQQARKVISAVYSETTGIVVNDPYDFGMMAMYIKEINESELAPHKGVNDLMEKLLGIIVILGIMGLTGISIYFATEREKEIAVRKVFGGTVITELWRNTRTFIRIALIANLVAIPIAVLAFDTILIHFADKIQNLWLIYIACVMISFTIILASVLWQTLRAARTNPAESLKKE